MGNPIAFHLTGGQAYDLEGADALLDLVESDYFLADKAYDADERVIYKLKAKECEPVIPPKVSRKEKRTYDKLLYQARHLIENFFARLKQFRGIATRYDKTASSFLGGVYLAAISIWLI